MAQGKKKSSKRTPPSSSKRRKNGKGKNGKLTPSIGIIRLQHLLGETEDVPKLTVPDLSTRNPFVIKTADPSNPKLLAIDSPVIGSLANENPLMDPLRNALKLANAKAADAVIVAGNLIYFISQHYGSTYPYKTQVSALPTDAKVLNKVYPPAVLNDSGSIEARLQEERLVFIPVKARLDIVLEMLKSKFVDQEGKPIFGGQILITFGAIEEALVMQHTNEMLRTQVFQEKAYAQQKVREYKSLLKKERGLEHPSPARLAELERAMNDFMIYERLFAIMGNAAHDHINKITDKMISYIIWRLEKDIPNAKVVSIGDAYLRAGNRLIQTKYERAGESLNDGFAGRVRDETYSRIKNNPGESIPDVILCAGLNPTFRNLLVTHRVRERKSTLDDVKFCHIIQLTTCINDELYRHISRRRVRVKDDLTRLAGKDSFVSGVLWLEWVGDFFRPEFWSGQCLTDEANFKDVKNLAAMVNHDAAGHKRLYFYKEGCSHYGARYIETNFSPKDPNGRYVKLHYQTAFELLLASQAPIAGYQHDGDACHWINYETFLEEHDAWLGWEDLYLELTKLESQTISFEERMKRMKTLAMRNDMRGGIINPLKQLDQYIKSLEPYLDFWARIIEYCRDNNVEFRGKFAPIVQGRGNHNEHSFPKGAKVDFSEATEIRQAMVTNLFEKYPHLSGLIKKNFIAPHIGRLGYANGIMAVIPNSDKKDISKDEFALQRDYYVYALKMKHKQGSSKSKDNMANMLKAFAKQGTANQFEAGRMSINLAGDDHFGGIAITRNAFHVKTGCQTFENEFGKRFDFPEQNLFSAIWSVPVGGPAAGPFSWTLLDYSIMRKYAASPFPVDRAKLFRGALEAAPSDKK
ncbi:MAG: hypothetical protein A2934_04600 [Candidatus Sungbacteria bacterium RIFCSPLOWO2_01_FULL_47_10]|uniref:Uncharacterized protein n=1 Tax=Candidatus Sungbacteria bacterium RIFCSPLOWO2_01_FULL_47_10 TaxID=1802276 RepID=A0A1G2L0K4_9BACT|nr:MAG: hypothetical protein A2934_04600 [Candidatus Sungbacteria bacterium RIFCSPLOWO2_01_FULL_47_10]